jgi:hypothetical protein
MANGSLDQAGPACLPRRSGLPRSGFAHSAVNGQAYRRAMALLARSRSLWLPDGMFGGPLVQDFRRKVHATGPGDCADLRVNSHLGEEHWIVKGAEHPFPPA